jgi:hypothetical protein
MASKYNEGPEAKESFERTMTALFRAPKPEKGKAAKKSSKPSPSRKRKSSGMD